MFLMNLAILINLKLDLTYYQFFYATLPVVFYAAFNAVFYLQNIVKTIRRTSSNSIPNYITFPALIMNIVYFIIEFFVDDPNNPYWFYISTASIQFINCIFIFAYQKLIIDRYMNSKEATLNTIFLYIYTALSIGAIYACVCINIYVTVILLLATAAIMTFSLSLSRVALVNAKRYRKHTSKHSSRNDDDDDSDDDE